MKNLLSLLFIIVNGFLFSQMQDRQNLIKGKWEFKVFSDSIAFPDIPEIQIKTKNKLFLTSIEFTEKTFTAKKETDKVSGKWIIIGNNLILNFSNKISLLYEIMRLNSERLELKEEGMLVPNLGYDRIK
jgi:hypothetical protein